MQGWIGFCALCLLGGVAQGQEKEPSTYDAVIEGTECTQSHMPYQTSAQLNCVYTVGTGLKFVIAGVGQSDGAILVERATGLDSDFYFKFGVQHGCVIVTRGFGKKRQTASGLPGFDMAFVSPRTGRVYRTWQECAGSRGS